jgi:hypothetical protein
MAPCNFEVAPATLWVSVFDPGVAVLDGGNASEVQSDTIDGGPADAVQVLWLYGGVALFPW